MKLDQCPSCESTFARAKAIAGVRGCRLVFECPQCKAALVSAMSMKSLLAVLFLSMLLPSVAAILGALIVVFARVEAALAAPIVLAAASVGGVSAWYVFRRSIKEIDRTNCLVIKDR